MVNKMISQNASLSSLGSEIEQESFSLVQEESKEQDRVVFVSYNIRYAVGSFLISGGLLRRIGISRPQRRKRLVQSNIEKVAKVFSESKMLPQADFIALQEADKETLRSGRIHVARELARRMSFTFAHAQLHLPKHIEQRKRQWYLDFEEPIRRDDAGDTGLAMLSRFPLEDLKRLDLPWFNCPWRPRIALAATINLNKKKIRVFNSHIDPHASIEEQLEQHKVILDQAERDNLPTVLLGDFNTLTPMARRKTRKFLEEHGYISPFKTGAATWRAGLYRNHTDWIFTRGLYSARYGIVKPLSVSDHWPIWAEIELK
jgi:endonuclease/exonuclease/phosphatase family metal-dependent hydrolase